MLIERPPPAWTVLCDFDGTVSLHDLTDALLARFARPGWQSLEDDWRAGRIGSRQCMAGQIALLDCSRDELEAFVAEAEIDAGFKAFVAALREEGVPLRIVSDGLDHAIRSVLMRHGISGVPVAASHLVQAGERSWRLAFPQARNDCASAGATCKCAFAEAPQGLPSPAVLMIGDGASDFCAATRADLTFARGELLAHCVERGLPHYAVADFGAALRIWNGLRPVRRAETIDDKEFAHGRR
jgi:2,3-diketo-5-methylthio-1-phosphopentane phosphatase